MSKSVTLSPSAATTGRKKNTTMTSIAGAAKVQPASERVMVRLRRGHRSGPASSVASPGSHGCGGRARPPPRPHAWGGGLPVRPPGRHERRRGGKEGVSTCKFREVRDYETKITRDQHC